MYDLCRRAAAESAVLLKNENELLPLGDGTRVAVFGRIQTMYYKCGTGSGGRVNIEKQPRFLDSLRAENGIIIDESLASLYESWVIDHPYNDGKGMWAGEPWYQEEMPLDTETVTNAAARNDVAVIIIGRSAGEDHDNGYAKGGYLLTDEEENMMSLVSRSFNKVIVALNVGNIIDLSFVKTYGISAVMYLFHGGMAGADAFSDILVGKTAPCGKLPDTVVTDITRHPAHGQFGRSDVSLYVEDVYVGYRYFETFDPDAVDYPFGYGLTYTTFDVNSSVKADIDGLTVTAIVKNTGNRSGREVVQVYVKAPCGALGNPSRKLVAFKKTGYIEPNSEETVTVFVPMSELTSYDDGGITGHKSCYVLEAGEYGIYVGADVRSAPLSCTYYQAETCVVKECEEAMAPVTPFKRLNATLENGEYVKSYVDTPLCTVDVEKRISDRRPDDIAFTGDKEIKLPDVKTGKNTMDEFIAQLTDEQLAALVCGEGSCSPKATPGTVGCMGGQSVELDAFGIPVACVADGPSGIRFDGGKQASLLPIGTLLAASFDTELVEALYSGVGYELKEGEVDSLLGPGMNIHRHPLCGRNFEYYSEDPILTGKIAAAACRGIGKYGCFATIKHLCCNSQEFCRTLCDSAVSERALREIYLKGFEIAVKEGERVLIMTSYNPINGFWAASNYDLVTTILRRDWGFERLVMTDWWTSLNLTRGKEWTKDYLQAMVRAGNDVYMVCKDAEAKSVSVLRGLKDGYITRGELQGCVKRLLNWIMETPTYESYVERGCIPRYPLTVDTNDLDQIVAYLGNVESDVPYEVAVQKNKNALISFSVVSKADSIAQDTVVFRMDDNEIILTINGEKKDIQVINRQIAIPLDTCRTFTVTYPSTITMPTLVIKQ